METESLKSLGWLLLWGGFFYVMMRHGCGAHMMGGHGHHGHGEDGRGDSKQAGDAKDPVCGVSVEPKSAAAAAVRGGSTYYFCSTSCRDQFEQAPEQPVGSAEPGGNPRGGHHE